MSIIILYATVMKMMFIGTVLQNDLHLFITYYICYIFTTKAIYPRLPYVVKLNRNIKSL